MRGRWQSLIAWPVCGRPFHANWLKLSALQQPQLLIVEGAETAGETRQVEEADVMARLLPFSQIGHDLADDAGELIAMPRKTGGKRHLWMVGVEVNDEMLIRRVSEHTRLERHRRPRAVGEISRCKLAQRFFVLAKHIAC